MVKYAKQIGAILGGITLLASSAIAWEQFRPFVYIGEHQIVATRSCENKLNFLQQQLWQVERLIKTAETENNIPWLTSLLEQERGFKAAIAKVKRECGFE